MDQKQYTLQNFFESPECLTQSIMLAYANGTATDQEARKVEMHITDCQLCDEALEGMMLLSKDEFIQMSSELQNDVKELVQKKTEEFKAEGGTVIDFRPKAQTETETAVPTAAKKSGSKRWMGFVGIAASIALLAMLSIFLMSPSASSLADKYFDATVISSTRGMGSLDQAQFDQAVEYYEAKEYSKAAPLFDNVDSIVASYFAGNCYFNTEEFEKAEDRFKAVIEKKQTWVEHAEYNLSMTYLKLGKLDDARKLLSKIAADDNQDFQNLAKEALVDVNNL